MCEVYQQANFFMLQHSKNAWLSGLAGYALNLLDTNCKNQNKCTVSNRDGVGTDSAYSALSSFNFYSLAGKN